MYVLINCFWHNKTFMDLSYTANLPVKYVSSHIKCKWFQENDVILLSWDIYSKHLIQQIKFLPMASPLSYGLIFQCALWVDPKIYDFIRLNVRKIMKMITYRHSCIKNWDDNEKFERS